MDSSKSINAPISPSTKLVMDDESSPIKEKTYRGMIGSLLYLTASRPDIVFSVGLCARFQSKPNEIHLQQQQLPKKFPLIRGVGRSRCTRSYPYAYKTHRETSSNRQ